MPNRLKIMSWNLRTYGSVVKKADEHAVIAQTILDSRADIVCIQELMPGHGIKTKIGAAISWKSTQEFNAIIQELGNLDGLANWTGIFTGRNAGKSPGSSMRRHSADAYGFLWKGSPDFSDFTHALPEIPAMTIELPPAFPNNPRILNVAGFPNRRPGHLQLTIEWKAPAGVVIPALSLNLLSFHATTPENKFTSKVFGRSGTYPAAGTAIKFLNRFPEIALPPGNTIVLGDFNFDLRFLPAVLDNPYESLTDIGYGIAIDNPLVKTTYSPNSGVVGPARFVSSYDNIFHIGPNLQHVLGSGQPIDFIFQNRKPAHLNPLVQAHNSYYGRQHGRGVSDHLPVVAEYDVR